MGRPEFDCRRRVIIFVMRTDSFRTLLQQLPEACAHRVPPGLLSMINGRAYGDLVMALLCLRQHLQCFHHKLSLRLLHLAGLDGL